MADVSFERRTTVEETSNKNYTFFMAVLFVEITEDVWFQMSETLERNSV
jgi:hypothetical protein